MRFPLPARLACLCATAFLLTHHAPGRCATPVVARAVSIHVEAHRFDLTVGSLLALSVGK